MGLGLLYWILMLLWLVFSVWWHWPVVQARGGYWPSQVFIFFLFVIIGWSVFGPPIRG